MDKNRTKRISELLEPTEAQKERMFKNITGGYENGNAGEGAFKEAGQFNSGRRFKPALVAAVMIFCVFTTTAFASAYLGLDVQLLRFLNPSSDEQAEYLANGAYVVDKQVKNKNGTLEIKQVIGDSNLTYILMDFIAPEGVILNADRYRFDCDVDVDNYSSFYSIGFTKLEDEDPADNKISLILELQTERPLQGGKMKLRLKELEGAAFLPETFEEATGIEEEDITFKTVLQGDWRTSFMLDFKDISRTYTPNSKVNVYGYEAMLESVSVSPISIVIKFTSPFTREIHEAAPFEQVEYNLYRDAFPVTIHYKDGSEETTVYATGMSHGDFLGNKNLSVKKFENMINDKKIEFIEIFDTIVNL